MASNPIPESVRRQVWDLLRAYKDAEIVSVFGIHLKLEYFLSHALGYDRGPVGAPVGGAGSTPPKVPG